MMPQFLLNNPFTFYFGEFDDLMGEERWRGGEVEESRGAGRGTKERLHLKLL